MHHIHKKQVNMSYNVAQNKETIFTTFESLLTTSPELVCYFQIPIFCQLLRPTLSTEPGRFSSPSLKVPSED